MIKGRIWVKNEKHDDKQSDFGETISILITCPDDCEKVLFKAGPYTIPTEGMITHDSLVANFDLDHIPED